MYFRTGIVNPNCAVCPVCRIIGDMDQSTPEQHAELRRAALVRRDYAQWLAKALDKRATDMRDAYDRDLLQAAAQELRDLVAA